MTVLTAPTTSPAKAPAPPRYLARSWVAVTTLVLMVASEYRFTGGRSQEAALSGQSDARSAIEIVVYGAIAVFLVLAVAEPPRRARLPSVLAVRWGFALAMLFVAFWSPFPVLAVVRGAQLVIVTWLGQLIARRADRTQLWRMAHWFVVLVAVSVAVGIAAPVARVDGQEGRFTWLYLHPNISGAFLAIASTVTIASLLLRRQRPLDMPWPQWAYLGAFAVCFGALLASRSRGSLAGAVVGILVVLWSASRRRSRLDLVLVGGALLTIVWLLAAGDIIAFLERGESAEELGSLNSRTAVWEQGWELFRQRPVFGHGFMSARGVFLDTFGLGGAHNAFVEVLVNSGLFGIFWWVALLVLAVRAAGRLGADRHPDGPLLLGVLWCLLVNALTDGGLGQATTVHALWLVVAVGWAVAARRWVGVPPAVEQNDDGRRRADLASRLQRARRRRPSGGASVAAVTGPVSSGRSGTATPVRHHPRR